MSVKSGQLQRQVTSLPNRHIELRSTDTVEVIQVRDDRHDQPHYLLLTTSRSETVEKTQATCCLAGKIDIHALYLFGPLSQEIGNLVCQMGGEISANSSARITNGDVLIRITPLRSLRIASFMLNRIVRWVKCFEPERTVRPLQLVKQDANEANRARRNQLYRRFGIPLVFKDPMTEQDGHSADGFCVGGLVEYTDGQWKNISVTRSLDGFKALYHDKQMIRRELSRSKRMLATYKRKSQRFEAKVRFIQHTLYKIINFPSVLLAAVVGYGVGSGQWRNYLSSVKLFLGL